jgi:hypothetical protein
MTVELRLSIDDTRRAHGARIPTTVRNLDDGSEHELLVPVGPSPITIQLEPGHYLVEAYLPSGELLRRPAELHSGSPPLNVRLSPSRPPHESSGPWLPPTQPAPSVSLESYCALESLGTNLALRQEHEPTAVFWSDEKFGPASGAASSAPGARAAVTSLLEGARRLRPVSRTGDINHYEIPPGRSRYETGTVIVELPHKRVLVPLPGTWRSFEGQELPVEVAVDWVTMSVSTTVADPVLAPVLGYLSSGYSAVAARALGCVPFDLLLNELRSPFAAAAGGYALVQSLLAGEARGQEQWRPWIRNLAERFSFLPDGAILEGCVLLEESPDSETARSEALEMFLEAFRRGLPHFAVGLRLLRDRLLSFEHEPSLAGGRSALDEARRTVRQWATWVAPREPFTTLHIPMEE